MNLLKLISLVSLGGSVELYDFVIFAAFSEKIGATFFPNHNSTTEIISALGLFAVGYLVRPIGGVFFSHFGDKLGRKKVFMNSILIMGISTFCMACIPSYASIGILGSLLFVMLRIVQGLALGAEIPGAITFIVEHSKNFPGLACGLLFLFNNLGIFIADTVHTVNSSNWREAFIIGAAISFFTFILRRNLPESPAFEALKNHAKIPLITIFRRHTRTVLSGIMITSLGATVVSVLYISMIGYLKNFAHYSTSNVTSLTMISTVTYLICMALMGALSDLIGQKRLLIVGIVLFALFIVPFYGLIKSHSHLLPIAFTLLGICSGMITGTFPYLLTEMFPVQLRYTGVAICFNIGFAIFAGLSPLIASIISPAYLILGTVILSIIGLKLRENGEDSYSSKET